MGDGDEGRLELDKGEGEELVVLVVVVLVVGAFWTETDRWNLGLRLGDLRVVVEPEAEVEVEVEVGTTLGSIRPEEEGLPVVEVAEWDPEPDEKETIVLNVDRR